MSAFLPLLLTWLFGILVTFLISPDFRKIERLGLGYLLGVGLQTFMMFIFYLINFRYTLNSFLIEWALMVLVLGILLFLLGRLKITLDFFRDLVQVKNFKGLDKNFIVILSIILLVSLIVGLYWPVIGWDAIALYDFRAKTFVITGGMEDGIARGFFFGYPLLTSLGHTWIYFFKGNPHVMYWLFYGSFLMVIYQFLREKVSSLTAKTTVVLLALFPPLFENSFFDYANLPYWIYIILSFVYIDKWIESSKIKFLVVAFLLCGLSTWSRMTEPFWITTVAFSILGVIIKVKQLGFRSNRSVKLFLSWVVSVGLFAIIQQSWKIYQYAHSGHSEGLFAAVTIVQGVTSSLSLSHLIEVLVASYTATVSTWQPEFFILLVFALLEFRLVLRYKYFFGMIFFCIALLLVGTYQFSLYLKDWKEILPSQQRLANFLLPLFILMIALLSDNSVKALQKRMNPK